VVGTRAPGWPPARRSTARDGRSGPGLACVDNALSTTVLPSRPLGDSDLVVTQVSPERSLVWAITGRYASGEGFGPVALIERTRRAVLVRAQGVLRAFPTKARFRLEKVGATELLVAEGERCGAPGDPCDRTVRFMTLRGEHFEPVAFQDAKGSCVTPGLVYLLREESDRLDSGLRRRQELSSTLTFSPNGIAVQEQVVIRDVDPRTPTSPGRIFRKAEGDFTVTIQPDGRFVTSGPPLWGRMRGKP
jgi:hypothetical protein